MIHYHVEMQGLTEIESALGVAKDKSKMVLRSAINNAAKQTEDRMVTEAKTRYRYKRATKGDIREEGLFWVLFRLQTSLPYHPLYPQDLMALYIKMARTTVRALLQDHPANLLVSLSASYLIYRSICS